MVVSHLSNNASWETLLLCTIIGDNNITIDDDGSWETLSV